MQILKTKSHNDSCVIKTSLKNIVRKIVKFKDKKDVSDKIVKNRIIINTLEEINNIVDNCNKLITQTYFFLKSWILFKYEAEEWFPKITEEVILLIFKVLKVTKVKKKINKQRKSKTI